MDLISLAISHLGFPATKKEIVLCAAGTSHFNMGNRKSRLQKNQ
jgi:hypothetical protein